MITLDDFNLYEALCTYDACDGQVIDGQNFGLLKNQEIHANMGSLWMEQSWDGDRVSKLVMHHSICHYAPQFVAVLMGKNRKITMMMLMMVMMLIMIITIRLIRMMTHDDDDS